MLLFHLPTFLLIALFFFTDTATTEIYTLSLHDALPILYHSTKSARDRDRLRQEVLERLKWRIHRIWSLDWYRKSVREKERVDRKSTRLNSSHTVISYAVFCLKKKNNATGYPPANAHNH